MEKYCKPCEAVTEFKTFRSKSTKYTVQYCTVCGTQVCLNTIESQKLGTRVIKK